jgi:hypothetical protein
MKWLHKNSNPMTPAVRKNNPDEKILLYNGYGLGFLLGSYDGI